jgi:hypothetical protein
VFGHTGPSPVAETGEQTTTRTHASQAIGQLPAPEPLVQTDLSNPAQLEHGAVVPHLNLTTRRPHLPLLINLLGAASPPDRRSQSVNPINEARTVGL